jgi:hypothetical protein
MMSTTARRTDLKKLYRDRAAFTRVTIPHEGRGRIRAVSQRTTSTFLISSTPGPTILMK